jgi:formylglycine-generating enzyme required for sulfatase activity/tRNA A-37 threonylcarbamoyl transferase component Bud32
VECNFCGNINDQASRFCNSCGKPLNRSTTNSTGNINPFKTVVPSSSIFSNRIPAPDGKIDSKGVTLMVHPDGTLINNKYSLYYLTAGGMGAIYMAQDVNDNEWYIIKEAASTDREEQLKLMVYLTQEREALIRLKHPSIVKAYELFIESGDCYLVLEYIDGRVMEHIIEEHMPEFLPEEAVLNWAIQIADVLDYLHNQDPPIIYRDLKPDNIMVNREGNIKVIDFGATRVYKEGKERDTKAIGTAGFAAPEQYGSGQTEARSDIYSLGATMHYLLTNRYPGEMPFVFPLARSLNPSISDRIDLIIQKAVQPDIKNRFASAMEMKTALLGEDGQKCNVCLTINKKGYKFCKKCGKKPSDPGKNKITESTLDLSKITRTETARIKTSDYNTNIQELPAVAKTGSSEAMRMKIPETRDYSKSSDLPLADHSYREEPLLMKESYKTDEFKAFTFRNGSRAYDINELIDLCRKYPEEGRLHLQNFEFTPWLFSLGIPDYALEETILEVYPPEYDLVCFCAVVSEFLEHMKLKKVLPDMDEEELVRIAKKHNLTSLLPESHGENYIEKTDEEPATVTRVLPEIIKNEIDQSEMILIPAGNFLMGKQGGEDNPRHKVYLDNYYIDKYPVTNLQYEKFTKETKYKTEGDWGKYYSSGAGDYPVTCLTWNDACAYLKWSGKRLPTEAEWEKAAAGPEGQLYPWGDKWDPNKCNNLNVTRNDLIGRMMNIENNRGTIPVGAIPEGTSIYGVEDMAGNVWEWCYDWYEKGYYTKSSPSNPQGPSTGKYKVARGGSWKANYDYFFQCPFRRWTSPQDRITFCSFRGVKDIT